MLAILALCVSACNSVDNVKNDQNLSVDSTTNIQAHDSLSSAVQRMNDSINAK